MWCIGARMTRNRKKNRAQRGEKSNASEKIESVFGAPLTSNKKDTASKMIKPRRSSSLVS